MIEYEPKSWLKVLLQFKGSILPGIFPRLLVTAAIGAFAAWAYAAHGFKIPPLVHTLVGVALGLLLVFRTNASYDRYWEGRRLLGSFVNRSRDLVRQAAALVEGDDDAARADRAEIRRLVVVFFALLRQYLRKERDLSALGAPLEPGEREALEPVLVRPNLAAAWLGRRLRDAAAAGRLTEQRLQLLDANVTVFVDIWGGTERIMKTPIPFAYAQHIKSFLTLFCFSVPFAMVETLRWYTPIAAAVLGYALFGIDEIGVEIEDPFGYDANDLPLDAMGKRIEEDTAAILESRDGG